MTNEQIVTSASRDPRVLVVGSVSGAPGASCVALGLVAQWPDQQAVLVEADPSGGVLAARFGLRQGPGLDDLAAAARHGAVLDDASPFVQHVPVWFAATAGPGPVVAQIPPDNRKREAAIAAGEPLDPSGAVGVLGVSAESALRRLAPVIVVDVGRLYVNSPALGLLRVADAVVVVTHPDDDQLDRLYERLPDLRRTARPQAIGLAVTGKSRHTMAEIADQLAVPVWAQLPRDRWGAGALTGRMAGRTWARTRLGQSLKALAAHLAAAPRPAGARAAS
jgi:hypothetical protein